MRSWSIPLGRLFGIEIRLHLTFLFLLAFVWSTESTTQDASAALRGLALVGIILGSVILHEAGRALATRGSGFSAKTPSMPGNVTYESLSRDRWSIS
jgi:Zn-dependent protease